ncbi:MAG: serine/threonine protein kinase [Chitinophagaceae bacterium]|nr:serine/threonine protein kinase [Anaerolineae bacterium]
MAWREGEKIGPYIILSQLGAGGMATVYKAHHPELDRYVAIKVMHQAMMDDSSFQTRFQREAQIVAGLDHPHIVPVYDYQQFEGQPYLVMKLIEGETLKGQMSRGALTLEQIVDLMTAVGSALTYAHQKGVLHRDIKPSNIVIDKNNTPYVADFGLARITSQGESTISTDMVLGTPHYISPEQARGAKNLDARADIYSLGIVLYELVVGRVPFTADTPYTIIHDHIYTPLPLPRAVNMEIPSSVEEVLIKALAKDPQERYASADDLARAFREAVYTSKLTVLNPDRANIASISLARLRDEMQASVVTPYQGIPAARHGSTATKVSPINPKAARYWKLGGLISFLALCSLSSMIGLSAADNIGQLAETGFFELEQVQEASALSNGALYVVPSNMTVEEAEAFLTENPNDPILHLALAQAAWQANDSELAENALRDGLALSEDKTKYLLTAANIAQAENRTNAAITFSLLAYNAAANNADDLFTVRSIAGEYLYDVVETQNIDVQEIIQAALTEDEIANTGQAAPIVGLLVVRQEILQNRLRLAERTFNQVSDQYDNLAEYQLIQGELLYRQGQTEQARAQWEVILASEDAPEWITIRAQEFIDSLEE